jgi:tRNA (mo5U34)-methyltransferase
VLDLGTMDGAWAFEAERRHAGRVIATDIYQCDEPHEKHAQLVTRRFCAARELLGSKVDYQPGGDVEHLFEFVLTTPTTSPAYIEMDIIQCFGILYHVENPLLAFRNLRQCLTKDGLLLIETALWKRDNDVPVMRFNFDKSIYWDSTTFWIPNRKCLEQMLTLTGFRIQPETWIEIEMERANRVCFVAEAV